MGGEYFDVLKSMRARVACMPGPTRPSAEADEQHGAVEVPVHSAPEPFLDTAAAEALPQPVPPAHSTQPAAGTIKSGELRHRDGSQLAEHAASPSGASEMSSLSSLQEPLPGRVDDFDATLELSRRPIPAHSPKEAPQKATSKPEQSHAVADAAAAAAAAPAADAPPASAADAAPAAASKAVSQPAQAGAIHGLGWSLKAPLGSAAAKPSLSAKQWHHVRMWSFGDGKISARRTAPKSSASAAKKARVPAVPDGATKSANKQQAAAGPHKLPRQPQQHGFVPRPQQPPNNAQHPAPPMQQQQLPPPASAPGMPLSQAAQLRLPLLKIPPRSQAATSTAMRIKVPARPGAPRQGPSSAAAPAPKAGGLEALTAHVQPQPSAIQQQQDTSADEPGLMHPSWMDEGLEAAERLQLLACDEVLPETDLPLRPQPRVNLARNLGLLRPPSLLTAPSVTQKFQERLTAAMSSPDRHATAFPLGTPGAGGSAFADARHAANNGAPSGSSSAFASVSQPRRKSAWEAALEAVIEEEGLLDWHPDSAGHHAPRGTRAGSHEQESTEHGGAAATRRGGGRPRRAVRAPVGFFEEPDFSTGGDTETDSEARRPPMRRAAKSRRVGRPSKAPAQPSLPCSRVATFQDVQRWKRGLPKERKPAPASRAAPCQSPNRQASPCSCARDRLPVLL